LSADPVDLRLGHPDGGQRLDDVALRGLQLHLGVDQLENRRRNDVVLLLGQLEVLDRGLQSTCGHLVLLDRLVVREQRLVHLAREIALQRIVALAVAIDAGVRGGDARVDRARLNTSSGAPPAAES